MTVTNCLPASVTETNEVGTCYALRPSTHQSLPRSFVFQHAASCKMLRLYGTSERQGRSRRNLRGPLILCFANLYRKSIESNAEMSETFIDSKLG